MEKLSRECILPLEEEWEMMVEPLYGIKHTVFLTSKITQIFVVSISTLQGSKSFL